MRPDPLSIVDLATVLFVVIPRTSYALLKDLGFRTTYDVPLLIDNALNLYRLAPFTHESGFASLPQGCAQAVQLVHFAVD